jgi:aspartyl-tRNA(Asn)/glutamyl-tRNA(Gln) amidotransferase subunit C
MNQDDIARLAALARVPLTPEERDRFTGQLDGILDYVRQIQAVDTSTVADIDLVTAGDSAWRDDTAAPSLSADAALTNAPDAADGLFRVPKVL